MSTNRHWPCTANSPATQGSAGSVCLAAGQEAKSKTETETGGQVLLDSSPPFLRLTARWLHCMHWECLSYVSVASILLIAYAHFF